MGVMARQQAVSPVAAAGSSILIQLVTVATGIALVLVTGIRAVDQPVLAIVIGVILWRHRVDASALLPRLARIAASLTGKAIEVPPLSR